MRRSPYDRGHLVQVPAGTMDPPGDRPAVLVPRPRAAVRGAPFMPSYFNLAGRSKQLLPDNPLRGYLIIINRTGADIFVDFGKPASANSIPVPNNGNYELNVIVPSNSVNVIGTGLVIFADATLKQ